MNTDLFNPGPTQLEKKKHRTSKIGVSIHIKKGKFFITTMLPSTRFKSRLAHSKNGSSLGQRRCRHYVEK